MSEIYVVQRKPRINAVVQGKRPGEPVDPLLLGRICYRIVDTRTGDYFGEPHDDEKTAYKECKRLNDMHAHPACHSTP